MSFGGRLFFNGLNSFRMAERGGQPGNQNAVKGRPWRLAIDRVLEKKSRVEQIEALDLIAEKVINAALAGPSYVKGDPWPGAVAELADRLDGRAAQSVTLAGDAENPLFGEIKRKIETPDGK